MYASKCRRDVNTDVLPSRQHTLLASTGPTSIDAKLAASIIDTVRKVPLLTQHGICACHAIADRMHRLNLATTAASAFAPSDRTNNRTKSRCMFCMLNDHPGTFWNNHLCDL